MTDHLTQEQLLQYLDGELPRAAMQTAGIHIQSCWACRTELERLQEDIGTIHDAQKQVLLPGLPPPPRPWPRLEPRLVAAQAPGLLSWRRFGLLLDPMRRPMPALTVLAGLFAVWALLWLNPAYASAKEILRRVSQADAQRMTPSPEHFVRQKVKVAKAKHGSPSKQTGEVNSWRSARGVYWQLAESDVAATDLQKRYRDQHVADLPLSAASYQSWSRKTNAEGQVFREAEAIDVNFVALRQPGAEGLQKVSFRVRPADWHVTGMGLDFGDAQFEISEEDLTVLPKSDVPLDVLARLDPSTPKQEAQTLSARIVEPATPGMPPAIPPARLSTNPDDTEMDVRFTLHQIGADLGEPIEVARESSSSTSTVVRAWGASPERQALLRQLLEDKQDVRLELQPPPGGAALPVQVGGSLPAPQSMSAPDSRQAARRPDDERLAKWFGNSATQEDFTRSVLATSTDLLSRLFALKQLADRWAPKSESGLTEEAKAKLAAMILDHARAAAQRCSELRLMVKPLLGEFAPTSVEGRSPTVQRNWQDSTAQSIEAAKDADRLLRSLFTTSAAGVTLEEALPIIQQKLINAEAGISSMLSSKM
jgi:hypothetical protein